MNKKNVVVYAYCDEWMNEKNSCDICYKTPFFYSPVKLLLSDDKLLWNYPPENLFYRDPSQLES